MPFKFKLSPFSEVKADLAEASKYYRKIPRIFFTGANPFVLNTEKLKTLAKMVKEYYPFYKTIGCFARITDIMPKSLEDLKELKRYPKKSFYWYKKVIQSQGNDLENDIVKGFDLGADDYITKPFNILEVKARIKAIMRRSSKRATEDEKKKIFEKNGLKIDCDSRRVFVEDKEVKLTAKEYDLLELLSFHPNKVYSRENLLNIVWGYDYPGDVRTVDVHIRRLREKIEKNPGEPLYIHTKWGVGYYFQD